MSEPRGSLPATQQLWESSKWLRLSENRWVIIRKKG